MLWAKEKKKTFHPFVVGGMQGMIASLRPAG
jgi:hypothetical protein